MVNLVIAYGLGGSIRLCVVLLNGYSRFDAEGGFSTNSFVVLIYIAIVQIYLYWYIIGENDLLCQHVFAIWGNEGDINSIINFINEGQTWKLM